MNHIRILITLSLSLAVLNCASSTDSQLEAANQALNEENYQEAYDLAAEVLAETPTNLEAARVTASAQFGLSGLDTTDLNSALLELQDSDDPHFAQIADAVPDDIDLDQLAAAADTLSDCACTLDLDAHFQQGLYQAYAGFIIGIAASGYNVDSDTFDVTTITDAQVTAAETAFLEFDNAFIAGGVAEDDELVTEPREAICLVYLRSEDGATFDPDLYRALVCCELTEEDCSADVLTALTDHLTTPFADCRSLNPDELEGDDSVAFEACKAADTE